MSVVIAATLIAVAIIDDHMSFVEQESLAELQKEVERNPSNAGLKESLRGLDEEVRRRYFYRRSLVSIGGVLLLAGGLLVIGSLKLYSYVPAARVRPTVSKSVPGEGEEADAAMARRKLVGIGAFAAAGIAALAGLVLIGTPEWAAGGGAGGDGGGGTSAVAHVPLEPGTVATWDENWPCFRGPTGMGLVRDGDWPVDWDGPSGRNIVWKTEVPEPGHSSPLVWGDRIYLSGGDDTRQFVICFDRASGDILWNSRVNSPAAWKSDPDEELEEYEDTGFAASTGVTDGRHVVAFFGTADVACFDRDGTQVWARNLGRPESMYGLASSLSFHEGKVILQLDQGESAEDGLSSIMALAIATGRVLWETPRPVPNSWPSPVVIRTPSRDAIITCANPFVIAYSPADGTELWRAGGLSGDVGPSPVYADGMVYATNDGAQLLAIQTGGSGDVSETHVKWSDYEGMPDTASPICDGRFFLQATSNGGVSCYDAKSGKRLWDEEIGDGCNASPSLDGSTVYLLETEGVMHIFELGAEYKAGAKSALGERAGASPAFVDGRIYIRGEDHLFCIGKKD